MLQYALYVVMGGHFDFAEVRAIKTNNLVKVYSQRVIVINIKHIFQSDMAAVRRWWCLLLLTNYPVK